jgi:hypothetical protein
MTKTGEGELVCVVCGHKQKIAFWESINGTADPHLRECLLEKELNFARCESCGDGGFLAAPLVYYDTERKFCVQFCPLFNDDKLDEEMLAALMEEGILDDEGVKELEREEYVFEPHMVLDPEELILYIRFREKLYEVKKLEYGDAGDFWHSCEETVTIN